MTWSVKENVDGASRPFAVVNDTDGSLMGSHPTAEAANTHRRMLMLADPTIAWAYQTTKAGGDLRLWGLPQFDVKWLGADDSDTFTISGYAAVFGIPDLMGDRVLKGAFGTEPFTVPYLAFHDQSQPIGSAYCTPDDYGLQTVATLANTQKALDFRELARAKAIPAQSFGYKVPSGGGVANNFGGEDLRVVDTKEVSGVPIPANPLALIEAVKSFGNVLVPAWGPYRIPDQATASQRVAASGGSTGPAGANVQGSGAKGAGAAVEAKWYGGGGPISGSFEDLMKDVSDALDAVYPGPDRYVNILATFSDRVIFEVRAYGDDAPMDPANNAGTLQATYTRDPDDDDIITFGMPLPVELTTVVTPKMLERIRRKQARAAALHTKAGARHSRSDRNAIQKIHDGAVDLGAMCETDASAADDTENADDTDQKGKKGKGDEAQPGTVGAEGKDGGELSLKGIELELDALGL